MLVESQGSDGRGGTKDMYEQVSKHLGRAHILDINELFNK